MRFRALLIVALISLAPLPALAAWQSYTNRDGLTNNTVHLVLADRSGGLWVVTDAPGVSRYDGVAWHYYRQADGLPSDTITTILESRSGALWFGTPYGVSRYDGTSWGPILAPGGLTSTYVLASMEDHLGKLWVGTATGASFYDGNSWTPVTKAHGLLNYDVTALVEDRAGNIWFGAYEDGVSKYDGNSIITYGPIMFGNYLNGNFMAADSSGNVWLSGTTGETWRFDGATWREYTVNDGLANAFYSGPIFTDRSGQIWESQNGFAVSRFDGQHWRNLSTLNPETRGGLPAGNVLSISQDPDGNLWFGTQTDGLLRFDGSSWRAYALWPGGAAQCYDCGLKDHLGNLWFAAGGKIHKFDGLGWQTFPDPTTLSYNPVYSSVEWPSGKLWFGTFLGVLEFDPAIGQVTPFSPFGSLVLTMERDASGVIWMGTPNGVLRSITPTSFTSYTKANTSGGLPDDFVIKMAEDHAGNHWFSAGGSIVRLGAGQSATETVDASSGVGQYSSLALDSQGEPVIGYYNSSSSDVKIAHHSGGTWQIDTVQTVGSVGQYASMKLDAQGETHFSYYDIFNGDLIYASHAGGAWTTEAVDAVGFVGLYTSLALDAQGNPSISYYDFSNKRLKYASKAAGTWTIEAVDNGPNAGTATSLALDAQGNPHISYLDLNRSAVKLASKSGGIWTIEIVDATGTPTNSTSLALDSQGNPSVAYYASASGTLRYARRSGGVWSAQTADGAAGVGQYASLALDAGGNPKIAYYDATNGALKFAYGGGQSWTNEIVDSGGQLGQYASLVLDAAGVPHISYYDQTHFALKYATHAAGGWTTYRQAQLGDPTAVTAITTDHLGNVWFGSQQELTRFDGTSWQDIIPDGGNFGTQAGGTSQIVNGLFEDAEHHLWVGTASRGAMRYNGSEWVAYTGADGLQSSEVQGILQDGSGTLWFEGLSVVSGFDLDRLPPRPVVVLPPSKLSANRSPTVAFGNAYAESYNVQFSTSFNGEPWTPWSTTTLWSTSNLLDGTYTLSVRSRDKIGNLSPVPAVASFEIDATPPAPLLTFPAASQVLKDTITVLGSAADARFKEYRLEYRPSGSANWTLLRQSSSPVLIGALAGWNTRLLADGNYDLRLSVADTIGLSSSVAVTVTIDNVFPSADVTVPVLVREAEGGNVYTNTGDTHLYFPPHAFAQDAVVSVQSTPADSVPANLAAGLARVIPGWDVAWAAPLLKSARLDVGLSGFTGDMSTLAIYYDGGAGWSRLGGTIDPTARRLQLAVTQPGRYAVFGGTVSGAGEKTLGNLAFTPRVFSPSGTFADRNVGISFALGSPAPVTIRVYSMSGRMIREVASGQPMNAGQNMVKWDGRDHDGGIVTDGMYLVSVEALGQLQKKPLAVVK